MQKRKPTHKELNLICFLAKKGNRNVDEELNKIMVAPMNDGGMGSLVIFYDENDNEMADRHFGKQLSECTFMDKDGTQVIASLNLDEDGNLYELDIWKTDFSALIDLPEADLLTTSLL